MTGLAALDGVGQEDRELAASLLASVGDVVWVPTTRRWMA